MDNPRHRGVSMDEVSEEPHWGRHGEFVSTQIWSTWNLIIAPSFLPAAPFDVFLGTVTIWPLWSVGQKAPFAWCLVTSQNCGPYSLRAWQPKGRSLALLSKVPSPILLSSAPCDPAFESELVAWDSKPGLWVQPENCALRPRHFVFHCVLITFLFLPVAIRKQDPFPLI